ncbi:MAG: glycosyltransferase family 2 protein [Nanoarchaeota archaeon]|nr:glycosyltransferase family 2 protein [Nanoarchaeota archaeon]
MNSSTVSVIVPTYNESESIPHFIKRLVKCLDDFELIIIDDSPDDGTDFTARAVCEGLKLNYRIVRRKERGKGSAVREGLRLAKGEQIVIIDADLEYPPEEIKPMLKKLGHADVVLSYRIRKDPVLRRVASKLFRILTRIVLQLPFDTQSGLKVINQKAKEVDYQINGWTWDLEFVFLCKKKGLKITSHNVPFSTRPLGKTKVRTIHNAIENFVDLLRVRFRYL